VLTLQADHFAEAILVLLAEEIWCKANQAETDLIAANTNLPKGK
jgi:hypothetical protein